MRPIPLESPFRARASHEATAVTTAPEHLLALAEVGRELTSGGDISQALARAMRALDRRMSAQRQMLCVADPERRT